MTDHREGHNDSHMASPTGSSDRLLPGQQIASLATRLAPRTPAAAKTTAEAPTPKRGEPQPPSGTDARAAGKTTATRPIQTSRPQATRSVTRNVALSLDVGTQDALRRAAREADTSQAEIIYEALERYVAGGGRAPVPTAPSQGLFQRSAGSAGTGTKTVHTLRLPARNVEVIDDLVNQTGHPTRSALVEAALDAHLNGRRASA